MLKQASKRRAGDGRPVPHFDVADMGASSWSDKTTKLLLHFDGSMLDGSLYSRSVLPAGDARLDSTSSSLGGSSLRVTGASHLDVMLGPDALPGSRSLSIEGFFLVDSVSSTFRVWEWFQDAANNLALDYVANTGWKVSRLDAGTQTTLLIGSAAAIQTWLHVAVTRVGTTWRLLVDGVEQAALAYQWSPVWTFGSTFRLGRNYAAASAMVGNVDEVRLVVGGPVVASVPTARYGVAELLTGRGAQLVDINGAGVYYWGVSPEGGGEPVACRCGDYLLVFGRRLTRGGSIFECVVDTMALQWLGNVSWGGYDYEPWRGYVEAVGQCLVVGARALMVRSAGNPGLMLGDALSSYSVNGYAAVSNSVVRDNDCFYVGNAGSIRMAKLGGGALFTWFDGISTTYLTHMPAACITAAGADNGVRVAALRSGSQYGSGCQALVVGRGGLVSAYSSLIVTLTDPITRLSADVSLAQLPELFVGVSAFCWKGVCSATHVYLALNSLNGSPAGIIVRLPMADWSLAGVEALRLHSVDARLVNISGLAYDGRHVYCLASGLAGGALAKVDELNFTASGVEVVELGPNSWVWSELVDFDSYLCAVSRARAVKIPCRVHSAAYFECSDAELPYPLPISTVSLLQMTGGAAFDETLRGSRVTSTNVAFAASGGKFTGKASIVGTNSLLTLYPSPAGPNFPICRPGDYNTVGAYTLDFWLKFDALPTDYRTVFNTGVEDYGFMALYFKPGSSPKMICKTHYEGESRKLLADTPVGTWFHVEFSVENRVGRNSGARLFLNGKSQVDVSLTVSPVLALAGGGAAMSYGGSLFLVASGGNYSALSAPSANITTLGVSPNGQFMLAAVSGGSMYASIDGGASWTTRSAAGVLSWTNLICRDDGSCVASVWNNATYYESSNFGESWSAKSVGTTTTRIVMSSDGRYRLGAGSTDGWYYGNPTMHISSDYGATWSTYNYGSVGAFTNSVAMSASGAVMAGAAALYAANLPTHERYVYISVNYGATWTQLTGAGGRNSWTCCAVSADGAKAAFAAVGSRLWIYTVATGTFDEITDVPEKPAWNSVALSADGSKAYALSGDGYLYRVDVTAGTLEPSNGVLNFQAIVGAAVANYWGVNQCGIGYHNQFFFGNAWQAAWPGMHVSDIRLTNDVLHTADFTPPAQKTL
jgi:hypothetical protein